MVEGAYRRGVGILGWTPDGRRRRLTRATGGAARLLAAVVVGCVLAAGGGAAQAADVHGDDETDAYVGTGGLILPAGVDAATRTIVASCAGCHWRLSTPCVRSDLGHPFDGQSPCMSVVRGCPDGRRLLRTWFQPADGAWRQVGLVCLDPSGPVTVRDMGQAAHERAVRGIPPLRPAFQPRRGVVTQLPVLFTAGQPAGPQSWEVDLLGQRVHLVATPRWTWTFGDGASLSTDDPGGGYPDDAVAHVYRRSGGRHVTLTARWSASFTVDGLGPFPVPEPVVQEVSSDLDVGEGRALLAAP